MLGNRLKDLRVKKNVTQDDMAELLNIKRQTYSAYERGVSFPDVNALLKMAKFFGVSVDYLLENETKTADGQSLDADKLEYIRLVEAMTEDERKKLIDYAELLMRGRTQ